MNFSKLTTSQFGMTDEPEILSPGIIIDADGCQFDKYQGKADDGRIINRDQ
jgi:hypothetical protein